MGCQPTPFKAPSSHLPSSETAKSVVNNKHTSCEEAWQNERVSARRQVGLGPAVLQGGAGSTPTRPRPALCLHQHHLCTHWDAGSEGSRGVSPSLQGLEQPAPKAAPCPRPGELRGVCAEQSVSGAGESLALSAWAALRLRALLVQRGPRRALASGPCGAGREVWALGPCELQEVGRAEAARGKPGVVGLRP